MAWSIKITRAENGYLLNWDEELEDNHIVTRYKAVEETCQEDEVERFKTTDEEKIALGKLFEAIQEYFGVMDDRFDNKNLRIEFNKEGRKYVPEN